jgi:hypothetical protein
MTLRRARIRTAWGSASPRSIARPVMENVVPRLPEIPKILKGKVMRALRRYSLALLLGAAVVISAGGPASVTTASAHPARAVPMGCPAGTNWDATTQSCV